MKCTNARCERCHQGNEFACALTPVERARLVIASMEEIDNTHPALSPYLGDTHEVVLAREVLRLADVDVCRRSRIAYLTGSIEGMRDALGGVRSSGSPTVYATLDQAFARLLELARAL